MSKRHGWRKVEVCFPAERGGRWVEASLGSDKPRISRRSRLTERGQRPARGRGLDQVGRDVSGRYTHMRAGRPGIGRTGSRVVPRNDISSLAALKERLQGTFCAADCHGMFLSGGSLKRI